MPCRILVVEDDHDTRVSLRETLESEGYDVFSVTNGREALDALRAGVSPCLIVLDLMMPIMSGQEFLKRQNQDPELAQIPVVVASVVAKPTDDPTVIGYLKKPISFEQLIGTVAKYCERKPA